MPTFRDKFRVDWKACQTRDQVTWPTCWMATSSRSMSVVRSRRVAASPWCRTCDAVHAAWTALTQRSTCELLVACNIQTSSAHHDHGSLKSYPYWRL